MAAGIINGANPTGAFFDFNGDGIIDSNDLLPGGGGNGPGGMEKSGSQGGLGIVTKSDGSLGILTQDTQGNKDNQGAAGENTLEGRTSWRQLQ